MVVVLEEGIAVPVVDMTARSLVADCKEAAVDAVVVVRKAVVVAQEEQQNFHLVESVVVVDIAVGHMDRNHLLVEVVVRMAVVVDIAVHHLAEEPVVVVGFAAPRQQHLRVLVLLWCCFALNYCRCARVLPFNCPEFHR